ncbi:uncharacterized protein LOC144107035 [Amblyomma americanum]
MAWSYLARRKFVLALPVRRLRSKRKCFMYIRQIFDNRPFHGEYHHLVQELRNSDPEYHFKYFRMTKGSFDKLLQLVYHRILHRPTHRRPIYPAERLEVTLRFLATGGSMQDIIMTYRMHASTVSGILKETLPALWDCLAPAVLKTPSVAEWQAIRENFSPKWNFPNCVGNIDSKHFAITCPEESGSDFYDYKGFYSLFMLAVADADYRFIMVDVGAQGWLSDSSFFGDSAIKTRIDCGMLNVPSGTSRWPLFRGGRCLSLENVSHEALSWPWPKRKKEGV